MTPLDNLRRIVAGWRGQWRVDAHEGITLSHDGDEWPIGALDGDAVIMLVELLNAIRPAVDGATAEIERLTAELAAEQDKRSDAIRERNEAEERARSAEAGNRVLQAEVVRMDAELAAARAVPADVEAAIKSTVDGAEEAGRCSALGHAYLITKAPFWTVPHLKAAIARAIADATASKSATVGIAAAIKSVERIESTSKALGYSADYMAAIDRVLSCLRAVAENGGPLASTVDGGAGKPATVGGLLATAPVGAIVEWQDENDAWMRCVVGQRIASMWWEYPPKWTRPCYGIDLECIRFPARLVPAHLADADPATRGEIGAAPPANPHPDGCHTSDPTVLRDCTSDGHHECVSCARFDAAGRSARGDDPIGGRRGPIGEG